MRRDNRRRGAAMVEFSMVFLSLVLLLFAMFEYGRFVMMRDLVDNSAWRGARRAIVNTSTAVDAEIEAAVMQALAKQPLQNIVVKTYKVDPATGSNLGGWKNLAFGECLAVEVRADYSPIFPTFGLLPNPVKLVAKSNMRSEGE